MIDTSKPLYCKSTGRPIEYFGPEPVVKHRLRFSNGAEVELSEEEFNKRITDERPKYEFVFSSCPRVVIEGRSNYLNLRIHRPAGTFASNNLSRDQARELRDHLSLWLADR